MYFKVTKYGLDGDDFVHDFISVICLNTETELSVKVKVNKNDFEFWLLINNRLKWVITKSEGQVHRVEELEGTMSYEEYWSKENESTILVDLHDFIYHYRNTNYYQIKLKTINNGIKQKPQS